MQNIDTLMSNINTLNDFKQSIKFFLKTSYDEFEKKGYKKMVEESQKAKTASPFLSIIVRTQGRREESLREVFLCLEGQENQDFEIILIGHKLNTEQGKKIQIILDQQSPTLQAKIRFIALNYGNRTVPLNVGFANAWGKYIVTLDDDDVVFDNWVSNFFCASNSHNGRVLYNYTLAQNWSVIELGEYKGGLRAESAFDTEFARDYDSILQVELNRCPPVGLAYPAEVFQKMGIIFDEELATTEDWDYLTRAAFVCGVVSSAEPSCIYRKWINAETSFTVHKPEEWDRNYKAIINKTDKRMLCLPSGSVSKIVELIKDRSWLLNCSEANSAAKHIFDLERVYVKTNNTFSEENVLHASEIDVSNEGLFKLVYPVKDAFKAASIFRWDPIEKGILLFQDFVVVIEYESGESSLLRQEYIHHNGDYMDGNIIFIREDPQFIFSKPLSKNISKLIFQGKVSQTLPLEFYEKVTRPHGLKRLFNKSLHQK